MITGTGFIIHTTGAQHIVPANIKNEYLTYEEAVVKCKEYLLNNPRLQLAIYGIVATVKNVAVEAEITLFVDEVEL